MAITSEGHEVLEHESFDEEVNVHGVPILLRQGIACPCKPQATGQPDPSCNLCLGWGFIWNNGSTVMAFGPNRRINRAYYEQGSIDIMDALWTFPTGTSISHFDRFAVPTEVVSVSEGLTKGAVNQLTNGTKERTRFDKILAVERAVSTFRTPANGFPYQQQLVELAEGVDFRIINSNTVEWLGTANEPLDGAGYALRFRTEAEYICWSPMRSRYENTQAFPPQWLCKRIDFIRAVQ